MKKIKSYTAFYLLRKATCEIHLISYAYKNFRVYKGYADKYYKVD